MALPAKNARDVMKQKISAKKAAGRNGMTSSGIGYLMPNPG
jgi:hypothetical protein